MRAHRIETTLTQDGTLILDNLPFQAGEMVEVIILAQRPTLSDRPAFALRGTPVHYQRPTGPVADMNWARKDDE